MNSLYDFAAVFVYSDVAAQSPAWWHWINAQSSHALQSAFVPLRWFVFTAARVVKEIFGDIPNGDWVGAVSLHICAVQEPNDLVAHLLAMLPAIPCFHHLPVHP